MTQHWLSAGDETIDFAFLFVGLLINQPSDPVFPPPHAARRTRTAAVVMYQPATCKRSSCASDVLTNDLFAVYAIS